jgi:hypothetical protein
VVPLHTGVCGASKVISDVIVSSRIVSGLASRPLMLWLCERESAAVVVGCEDAMAVQNEREALSRDPLS